MFLSLCITCSACKIFSRINSILSQSVQFCGIAGIYHGMFCSRCLDISCYITSSSQMKYRCLDILTNQSEQLIVFAYALIVVSDKKVWLSVLVFQGRGFVRKEEKPLERIHADLILQARGQGCSRTQIMRYISAITSIWMTPLHILAR